MNRPPDVELVLRDYFADDGGSAPDHVLDIVEDRIARLPRRHAWRLRGRPYMNRFAKLAIGIAAVLIVGVIGIALVLRPGGSNIGSRARRRPVAGRDPDARPDPSPSPAALKSGVKGPGTFTGQFATSPIPWTVTSPTVVRL
jgi:hypothetical protein